MLASSRSSPYCIACIRCSELLISPSCSEYVSEHQIRHSWSCEACGSQFETSDRPLGGWEVISRTKGRREGALSW
jgi:hypothetical protein